jgi:hypothetical protein
LYFREALATAIAEQCKVVLKSEIPTMPSVMAEEHLHEEVIAQKS